MLKWSLKNNGEGETNPLAATLELVFKSLLKLVYVYSQDWKMYQHCILNIEHCSEYYH